MVAYYLKQLEQYPIISIEDGFEQDDWTGFQSLLSSVKGKPVQLVGWEYQEIEWMTNDRVLEMIWLWQMSNVFK